MFTSILVAYDGSELSQRALTKAKELAGESNAKLEVVHVLHHPVVVIGEAVVSPPRSYVAEYIQQAQSLIDQVEREIAGLPNAKASLLQGQPADSVLDYAGEIGADLIVIGSRGLSGLNEWVLGSVSHHVVQQARIPVLVIK
ncbi:universal stress protein [Paenibacillus sp. MZ04-78.2]|uniref:universal stress protein n=1 Tax=Paenibacillus sp. MZ04-78.2 TaxID=2962034 RepID=UPI0020B6C504|nr:universal stress protein [Paenibacillus sp. MZ04-78.2]MCP3772660.1 universal stress protein [Paenibacillus sp. MZ04-78.2]